MKWLAFIVAVAFSAVSFDCHAHGGDDHVAQMKAVFKGYDDKAFEEFFRQYTFKLDNEKRSERGTLCSRIRLALRKEYGCDVLHAANHRIFGHKWVVGAAVPRETIHQLESVHSNAFEVVKPAWDDFCTEQYSLASKLFGMPPMGKTRDVLQGFVMVTHSIHLLGDREPGNTFVDMVLPLDRIIQNIGRGSGLMLNDKAQGKEIQKALNEAAKSQAGGKEKAKAVMQKLIELKLGERLYREWGGTLERAGHQWTEAGV